MRLTKDQLFGTFGNAQSRIMWALHISLIHKFLVCVVHPPNSTFNPQFMYTNRHPRALVLPGAGICLGCVRKYTFRLSIYGADGNISVLGCFGATVQCGYGYYMQHDNINAKGWQLILQVYCLTIPGCATMLLGGILDWRDTNLGKHETLVNLTCHTMVVTSSASTTCEVQGKSYSFLFYVLSLIYW